MVDAWHVLGVALVAGAVTIALRSLPFVLFGKKGGQSPLIVWLGRILSPATIAILVVYCLGSSVQQHVVAGGGSCIAEIVATCTVVIMQWYWRKGLLSILAGTAVYMLMLQHALG